MVPEPGRPLGTSRIPGPFAPGRRRDLARWVALVASLMLAAAALGWRLWRPQASAPRCRLVDFPVGTIDSARFGADGQTIFCSLRVGGGPLELYAFDARHTEPRALGIHDALLLGVSDADELALLQAPRHLLENQYVGTLATVPAGGGPPRARREGVAEAVWDGAGLATLSTERTIQDRLEFPAGKAVAAWDASTRTLSRLTLSRDGRQLACVDTDVVAAVTSLVAFQREGGRRVLYTRDRDGGGGAFTGLAWAPGGELWVSELQGDQTVLWALPRRGGRRALWRSQGNLQLLDVSRDGRALVVQQTVRASVCGVTGGAQVDLSIQGRTQVRGISGDGRRVLLDESSVTGGGTIRDRCFLRPVDGGPARPLGKGFAATLTSDGRWVQVDPGPLPARDLDPAWAEALARADQASVDVEDAKGRSRVILFVPAESGRPFAVAVPTGYEPTGNPSYLLPDGQRVLASLTREGRLGWVLLDRRGGPPVQVTPPDADWLAFTSLEPLSPDGTRCFTSQDGRAWFVQSLAGGRPEPVRGLEPGERPVGWGADGSSAFLRSGPSRLPVTVTRLDLTTGARRAVASFSPLDPAGFVECRDVFATPDGRACVFSYQKKLSDLFVVEGLGAK